MNKYVNGRLVEMTEEEIAELKKNKNKIIPPTDTERLEALEMAILELAEVLANG